MLRQGPPASWNEQSSSAFPARVRPQPSTIARSPPGTPGPPRSAPTTHRFTSAGALAGPAAGRRSPESQPAANALTRSTSPVARQDRRRRRIATTTIRPPDRLRSELRHGATSSSHLRGVRPFVLLSAAMTPSPPLLRARTELSARSQLGSCCGRDTSVRRRATGRAAPVFVRRAALRTRAAVHRPRRDCGADRGRTRSDR
jgi:hypothetical protein